MIDEPTAWSDTVTESMTDRRRRLMRDELGRVAMRLFAERGFDQVTVDDIAAAAGTSPRTFFRYFPTKDDVVLDYERRLQRRLLAAVRNRPVGEGPVVALRNAYIETSHVERGERDRVRQLGQVLQNAPALRARVNGERIAEDAELAEELAARAGGRLGAAQLRVVVVAMGAVAAAEFRTWVVDGGRGDPAKRIAAALDLVIDGLGSLDDRTGRV
ncbi:TetR family transcriptional regulator [Mycolicibacterium hassiacum DSM 44199]|nr:TetR family transcriptional regulator [Mycolicibacterium hassiacum DSM 44199]